MSDPLEISEGFSSHESDAENLYDAIEILKEKRGQYLVKWAGFDPKNGEPWPDSWTNKRDCTDDMVQAWKRKLAQKKRDTQQRKAKKQAKQAKTRNSTVSRLSEASKASTSRPTATAGPSTRSLRSRTAVPDDRRSDSEKAYESISRTPAKSRKRRLSGTPILAPDSDSSPPVPPRPAKKRRVLSETASGNMKSSNQAAEDQDPDSPPSRSTQRHTVATLDDATESIVPSKGKGKGKSVNGSSASTPLPKPLPKRPVRPPKYTSLLQRHLDKHLNPDEVEESDDDDVPVENSNYPTPAAPRTPTGVFSLARTASGSRGDLSNILSPGGQARLDQFDHELGAPTQDNHGPTPLFLPGSSEERDSVPPRSPSRSRSRSRSRSHSPARRFSSPVVSDYARAASPPPRASPSRPESSRRGGDSSYRVGDVPETQSNPGDSPPSAPSVRSRMKPRQGPPKPVGPIQQITTSQFKTRMGQEWVEEENVEEVDELMSSIEQFSSPEKGSGKMTKKKNGDLERRLLDRKGKGREREMDADGDEEHQHERVVARGVEMAEAARVGQRAKMAEYDSRWKGTRMSLSQILEQKQRAPEVGVSMSTESDRPMPSTTNGLAKVPYNIEELRQEEEENTQDVAAFYASASDRGAGSRDEYGSDEEDMVNSMVNGAGDGDGDGDRSDRSEDRDTDIHVNPDVAERSAWLEERASQQQLFSQQQEQGEDDLSQDVMPPLDESPRQDDATLEQPRPEDQSQDSLLYRSMDLMYPPDEAPVVPESSTPPVVNGRPPKSKSRSTSTTRPKPVDDTTLELPPTASTREATPEAQSTPADAASADPRLDVAMSLLNVKSDENLRLQGLLADGRAMLVAEAAKNVVLQERIKTLETQMPPMDDSDIAKRLKTVEELLTAERAAHAADRVALDAAQRAQAVVVAERVAAQQKHAQEVEVFRDSYGKASQFADEVKRENQELQKRVKIAEEQTKEGVAMIRATFDLREATLRSEAMDWRNQAKFLREQAVRTNDDDLRKRAAEHPELVAKYAQLLTEHEGLEDQVESLNDDILVKQEELAQLERDLAEAREEIASLKAIVPVPGDAQVFRCGWRGRDTVPCPALCLTREELDLHASMHVTKALVEPQIYGTQ